jgi:DNA helicase-2/ATP-dependent DNA helicase PcrA
MVMQYRPDGSLLVDRFMANHPDVFAKIEELRKAARIETTPQLLGRMYRLFDVQAKGGALVLEHLELLRDRARAVFASEQALTLRIFVDWLALAITGSRADIDFDELEGRPPHMPVMTIHRAKGLEFPIVFVPSLTSPVVKGDGQPLFFADDDGLDARLEVGDSADIRSPRFDGKIHAERKARIDEEFRLFYVAVTRAQHQVVLVGGYDRPVNNPEDDSYSWRDEVVPARAAITAAGGVFR